MLLVSRAIRSAKQYRAIKDADWREGKAELDAPVPGLVVVLVPFFPRQCIALARSYIRLF